MQILYMHMTLIFYSINYVCTIAWEGNTKPELKESLPTCQSVSVTLPGSLRQPGRFRSRGADGCTPCKCLFRRGRSSVCLPNHPLLCRIKPPMQQQHCLEENSIRSNWKDSSWRDFFPVLCAQCESQYISPFLELCIVGEKPSLFPKKLILSK